jgi:SET domain-containing protein
MRESNMNEFYIAESSIHGFGCFNQTLIKKGERFTFHLLPVDKPHNLIHAFPYGKQQSCLVLSEFSYCNHADDPNFEIVNQNRVERTQTFEALRDIPERSELTIRYR